MPALEMKDLLDLEMAIMVRHERTVCTIHCCIPALDLQRGCTFAKQRLDVHWQLPVRFCTLDAQARRRECLQEELDFNLVVFNPYQDLMVFLKDAGMLDIAECAWCASSPFRQNCKRASKSWWSAEISTTPL